jgi:phosphoserine phosphatase RsbU/P
MDQTPTTHTTVLIIDDNYNDRKYWSDALRSPCFHYSVLEASNDEEGLNILRAQKVDCVVLDFDMPMCGFFTLVELVSDRERPKMAVVILTCLVHPVLSELTKHNGAQDWLVKQHTSTEDLHHAIQKAIASVKSLSAIKSGRKSE